MSASALHITKRSIAEVLYPRDSIVVCRNPECGKPLYRLERSIYAGESVEQSTRKYAPVTVPEVLALMQRRDLDAGQLAFFRTWSIAEWASHCDRIPELKPDAFAECPACHEDFVFGQVKDDADGQSRFVGGARGFVIRLAFIPPPGRGRRA